MEEGRRHRIALGSILAAAFVLPCVFFLGPRSIDGFLTVEWAARLVSGTYAPGEWPQSQRFGYLLPVAFLQSILGVNGASSALPGMLASLLHVLAAYGIGRLLVSPAAGLAAAGILTVLPFSTIHATQVFPDLPVAALGAAALALLLREDRRAPPRIGPILAAGALLGWAYLVKQTVVFLLVFLAGWILRGRRWRLAWVAAPVALAVAAEAVAFAVLTGDPLHRNRAGNAFVAQMILDIGAWRPGVRVSTMLWAFPSLLLNPFDHGFPWFLGLAWPAATAFAFFRKEPWARFLGALAAAHFLLATVWPLRLQPYLPALVRDARHLAGMLIPMAVLAGAGWVRLGPRLRIAAAGAVALLGLAGTIFTWSYLSAEDEGLRAAARVLGDRRALRIRATDVHGNRAELLRYRLGYDPAFDVRSYVQEELPELQGEWIVVDDRAPIASREGGARVEGRRLPIPAGWTEEWSGEFRERGDVRRLRKGDPYRVRIFRAP